MAKFAALPLALLCSMLAMSGCSDRARSIAGRVGNNMMMKSAEPPIGTARMAEDQSIILTLRSEKGEQFGHAQINVKVDDPSHQIMLQHVGGLKPGEEKDVPPFPGE